MPPFLTTTIPSYSGRTRSLPVVPTGRRGSAIASAIGLRKKSELDIVLDGEPDYIHSYSTFDQINGHIDIRFEKDTLFHDLSITFEGVSTTYVEKIASTAPTTGRTTGRHTFLKVQQPINPDLLPQDGLFEGGVTYTLPFNFVVPERLLPFICTHKVNHEEIRKEHTQLPPSLGDPSVSGEGHVLMDDLAPDMSKIVYSIRARATRWNAVGRLLELADKSQRIRVVPAREEAPPLNIDEMDSDHAMRKEKNVKKGFFKIGKTGRLVAETTQPKSLHLPHPSKRTGEPVSTMATINLRFDPASPEDVPPLLDSIVSKLRVYTFFGAAPYKAIPEVRSCDNWSSLHGVYPETISLSSRCLSTVSWVRHDGSERQSSSSSSALSRRPSAYSTSSTSSVLEPSCLYQAGSPFYTATILVPVALQNVSGTSRPKVLVPTFHSCIVSRIYSLELNLSYRTPGASIAASHVVLKSPIQISAAGGTPPAHEPQSDQAILAEIEEQFGIYEAQQLGEMDLQHELGLTLETPGYEEAVTSMTAPLLGTRHMSLAMPVGPSRRTQSVSTPPLTATETSPPEYHVGSGFNTSSPRDRPGGPRTTSVSHFAKLNA
ncbi:uncharacterized protein A1O9_07116 [Exophiala aquamarina CBS 119918]|uniref:Arrestin-like N-terminal domain-containing protein n=1 Tax=Exophiala aquamarina CBS 119918 TaxID=1182545 RepID=A0A072PAM2_9EURO|nr:uncharacterized protein A1O9_07116 [Exophiala aquamarina CBS 119918]KEF56926.1 hypothetical protein A1O9_07116 [Exophiala aquamarina CBS 119918]